MINHLAQPNGGKSGRPLRSMTLADAVCEWSRATPEAPAWWIQDGLQIGEVKWREIEQAMLQLSDQLARLGFSAGDRLVHALPSGLGWALVDLACAWRGIIHVPIDRRFPEGMVERILAVTEGKSLPPWNELFPGEEHPVPSVGIDQLVHHWLRSTSDWPRVEIDRVAVDPHDIANILFTSGTTGPPRGVMLSHHNLMTNALGKLDAVPQLSTDRRLNILPFAHAYARTCELSTWALSGSSILSVCNFDEWIAVAPSYRPTLINGVPYLFEKLMQNLMREAGTAGLKKGLEAKLGCDLRILASGGAPLSANVYGFFYDLGLPIVQGYGLTEASPVVCSNRAGNTRQESVGPPISDTQVRLDDENRLYVQGPGVMMGYWRDEAETARRVRDGWLDTGDRAEFLADGSLRILGRADDQIVLSTGDKIDPVAIENSLQGRFGIQRIMLIGNAQRFVSAIVNTASTDIDELLRAIQSQLVHLPKYAIPKKLIVDDSPWTIENGRIHFKGGLRREVILNHYRQAIDWLYQP